ncbi:hypothetical protein RJ639_015379 [Escallonia herrerae]|uniref:Uncharacterized protein n=1 Tax=Escallonia herrerae TaxID=1293975 RepID=A0AA89ALV1_9ASTE|nr:hypothetical protein RJ639_015379 [Escallonia herrerae]
MWFVGVPSVYRRNLLNSTLLQRLYSMAALAGRPFETYQGLRFYYCSLEEVHVDKKNDFGKFTLAKSLAGLVEDSSSIKERKPKTRIELKRMVELRIKKRVKEQHMNGKFHDLMAKVISNPATLRDAYNSVRISSNVDLEPEGDYLPFESMALELSSGSFNVETNIFSISTRGASKEALVLPNLKLMVVQEAIRIALEVVYKPNFYTSSHGCRSGRSHLSALKRGERESPAVRAVHKLKEKVKLFTSQKQESWDAGTVRIGKKWLGHGLKKVKESEIRHLADQSSTLSQVSRFRKTGMETDHWYKVLLKVWMQTMNVKSAVHEGFLLSKYIVEPALPQELRDSFYTFQKRAEEYVSSETASTLALLSCSHSESPTVTEIIAPAHAIKKRLLRYGLCPDVDSHHDGDFSLKPGTGKEERKKNPSHEVFKLFYECDSKRPIWNNQAIYDSSKNGMYANGLRNKS